MSDSDLQTQEELFGRAGIMLQTLREEWREQDKKELADYMHRALLEKFPLDSIGHTVRQMILNWRK